MFMHFACCIIGSRGVQLKESDELVIEVSHSDYYLLESGLFTLLEYHECWRTGDLHNLHACHVFQPYCSTPYSVQ